jgi:hypothetical protein
MKHPQTPEPLTRWLQIPRITTHQTRREGRRGDSRENNTKEKALRTVPGHDATATAGQKKKRASREGERESDGGGEGRDGRRRA